MAYLFSKKLDTNMRGIGKEISPTERANKLGSSRASLRHIRDSFFQARNTARENIKVETIGHTKDSSLIIRLILQKE